MITFSDAACVYIKQRIEKEKGTALRLTVKKTGCSGYSYFPSVISGLDPNDLVISVKTDLEIYVDRKWYHLLKDVQVDYVEEVRAGLKQKRLVFVNPIESSRCGCGESFHIEN